MEGIHVAIAPETLLTVWGIPITNSLVMSWIVVSLLVIFALLMKKTMAMRPGKFQVLVEILFGGILDFITETLGNKELARKYFPLLTTIFLFILIGNWLEFIPGVESIKFLASHGTEAATEGAHHGVALLRGMNTDLNMTLALALIAFFTIEISGIRMLGFFRYFSRFFNFHSVIGFFVGIIEFVSELIRLVSFSFRLFGNIFAGSILIAVIIFFAPYILPVPFMAFEVFVGFMQAAIFTLLTLFFIKLAITDEAH